MAKRRHGFFGDLFSLCDVIFLRTLVEKLVLESLGGFLWGINRYDGIYNGFWGVMVTGVKETGLSGRDSGETEV